MLHIHCMESPGAFTFGLDEQTPVRIEMGFRPRSRGVYVRLHIAQPTSHQKDYARKHASTVQSLIALRAALFPRPNQEPDHERA